MGAGRSGTVYKARHVMLDQYRAIKQIPARQENREEPEREARILKGLKHPGIPIIYDVFRTKESYFLVEEFLEGESLFALVSRRGSLSKAETVSYGIQLCRIISYLHHSADNPILHLDLQPKNILLCQDVLKLIDFDQAVFKSCGRRAARRCGTAGCAAPEQYTDEPLDEQTDIYAIGALLFYMRKGMFPNAGACPDGKAGGLTAVIGKCLCEKKEERYDSVSTLLRELISLEEESFSNQNLSSLTIAFAGSKPGIGVTHVSLGLAVFLADRGIPVLYEEKNESGAAWQIADDAGAYPDCQGVILAGPWRLLPDYGPAVHLPRLTRKEGENAGVRLLDYGSDAARAAEDADADALCLICGGKPWEREQTARAVKAALAACRMVTAVNHLGEEGVPAGADVLRKGGEILRVPFFPLPGRLDEKAEDFCRALYAALAGGQTHGRICEEAGKCRDGRSILKRFFRKVCGKWRKRRRG